MCVLFEFGVLVKEFFCELSPTGENKARDFEAQDIVLHDIEYFERVSIATTKPS